MPGVCCFWGAGERRPALDAGQLRIGVAHIGKRHAFGRVLTIDTGEDGHEFCAGDGLARLEGAVAAAGNGTDVGQCADRDRVPLAGRNIAEAVVAAVIFIEKQKIPPRPKPERNSESWNYSLMAMTTPEPTVRPPSRIAKRRPTSIAIGVISSTSMSTLSPGMHISTPSGRLMTPVTSVVRK